MDSTSKQRDRCVTFFFKSTTECVYSQPEDATKNVNKVVDQIELEAKTCGKGAFLNRHCFIPDRYVCFEYKHAVAR